MVSRISRDRFVVVLGVLLTGVIALSALGAHDPDTWMLENSIVPFALLALIVTYRRFPLSRVSYALIFLFLCLHEVGAHWTYAKVPYDDWTRAFFGRSLGEAFGFQRNHFDRLVHFSYGLLIAYPIREIFLRIAEVKGFWGYFLPFDLTVSTSSMFELLEWIAVATVGPDLGAAYLGSQGDEWDAHKDIAAALIGALIAMLVTLGINARCKRDFARDFARSLAVKRPKPLGEEGLERRHAEV